MNNNINNNNTKKISNNGKQYTMVNNIFEGHNKPIYSVKFNFCDLRYKDHFATVGSNRLSIYKTIDDGECEIISVYEDNNIDESFYACAWTRDKKTSHPYVIVAGATGLIKVVDVINKKLHAVLVGHGGPINELIVSAKEPSLLISASGDESLRLWNIATGCCIAIFSGEGGHRDDVLSVDMHISGDQIVSCGMDHAVKIWDLKSLKDIINKSFEYDDCRAFAEAEASIEFANPIHKSGALPMAYYYYKNQKKTTKKFPTRFEYFPTYSTTSVHNNYVDCVKWHGDYILSKSIDSQIVLWKPRLGMKPGVGGYVPLKRFHFKDCGIWFIRFATTFYHTLLCCGNRIGYIYYWNMDDDQQDLTHMGRLSHQGCNNTIRTVALSYDGNTIISGSENGNIWRWDKIKKNKSNSNNVKAHK